MIAALAYIAVIVLAVIVLAHDDRGASRTRRTNKGGPDDC